MLDSIEEAIDDIRQGKMVIVIDDEDRENEGDLVYAAEKTTPELVNFMATHGRGLICCTLPAKRASELDLNLMADKNTCPFETAFTVSVDAKDVTTTGISAADRSNTIQRLADDKYTSSHFVRPGHMFPLIAKSGGVLERRGQTEASVDLARLAGLKPAGVICEIMNEDGTMARLDDLKVYAKQHNLKLISIADMVEYLENK
ncbi:MAG: 3,4-dihydroxy-2-butanone-4-phosphate synthase [Lentisphaeraceae bacterium]|nr:3,4-dihydroxy-2-butanone-4-phosphate synthase [Lentisphaeraceae bacterium]